MLFLLLSILSMSALMVALKLFAIKNVNTSQAIVVNYVVAVAIGLFSSAGDVSVGEVVGSSWLWLAVGIGALFFISMNLYALSTRRVGVALTTIASRLALIIPILIATLYLDESLSVRQVAGVVMVAVALVVIFFDRGQIASKGVWTLLLPLTVFAVTGLMNGSTKYAQYLLSERSDYSAFEPTLFCGALLSAVVWYLIKSGVRVFRPDWRSIVGGLCLGTFNFLTTYGLLQGLRTMPTSLFYSAYYVGVVIVTAIVGVVTFGERLSVRKVVGMAVAVAAIVVISL